MDKIICYSEENKKYFAITVFDFLQEHGQTKINIVKNVTRDKDLLITVNKDDLTNSKYGTKENPIPVFNYKGVEKPVAVITQKIYNSTHSYMQNLEPTQQEYEHNVITYLTYIMHKEEFEQRFGSEK